MKNKDTRRKILGIVLALLVISGAYSSHVQSFFSLPSQQKLSVGDPLDLSLNFPRRVLENLSFYVENNVGILGIDGNILHQKSFNYKGGVPVALEPGKINLQLRLFGIIPVRKLTVDVLPQYKIVPGGHSIGVMLNAEGVIIVGLSKVIDKFGEEHNPAMEAGLSLGDIILKINGDNITGDSQVARIINEAGRKGRKITLLVKKEGQLATKHIKPILCRETKRYRIGLYIRDGAAGVGTLSFYDPQNRKYGALGHIITDADTAQPIDIKDGKITKASIQGIHVGRRGQPGEKIGMFVQDDSFDGNINKNSKFGIYGTLQQDLENPIYPQALPIALANQIEEGPAQILTVIEGEKMEKFNIVIERVLPQDKPDGKGLIIKVVDRKLLERTGGIVQGMSGSPIIQKGKIVGAVTHVLVNDPARGYGILIEWMLQETGSLPEQYQKAG